MHASYVHSMHQKCPPNSGQYVCPVLTLLYFFFWPLCCLLFFDIPNLIAPLVSSKSSFKSTSVGLAPTGDIEKIKWEAEKYYIDVTIPCVDWAHISIWIFQKICGVTFQSTNLKYRIQQQSLYFIDIYNVSANTAWLFSNLYLHWLYLD